MPEPASRNLRFLDFDLSLYSQLYAAEISDRTIGVIGAFTVVWLARAVSLVCVPEPLTNHGIDAQTGWRGNGRASDR